MPGGQISIEIAPDFAIRMTGPVVKVRRGTIDPEMFSVKV